MPEEHWCPPRGRYRLPGAQPSFPEPHEAQAARNTPYQTLWETLDSLVGETKATSLVRSSTSSGATPSSDKFREPRSVFVSPEEPTPMTTCTMRLRSASNVAPVPRKPFIGKMAKDQSLSGTSVNGERRNAAIQTSVLRPCQKLLQAVLPFRWRDILERNPTLQGRTRLEPNWNPRTLFVLAEVLV